MSFMHNLIKSYWRLEDLGWELIGGVAEQFHVPTAPMALEAGDIVGHADLAYDRYQENPGE